MNKGLRAMLAVAALGWCGAGGQQAQDDLAGNTVLLVRHAEKPTEGSGDVGLTEKGRRRALAYARYFEPFHEDGLTVKPTALYAGADSKGSNRPRLTLEPLSKASGLPLDTSVGTKDAEAMVALLRTHPHGATPLLCWRHGAIPALLTAFGGEPEKVLPGGKWPDETFDWVIVLRFGPDGKLASEKLVKETLAVE